MAAPSVANRSLAGPSVSTVRHLLGLGVHLFTASGVLWAFLALDAATSANWQGLFLWLGVALFVDGIDGTVARRLDIVNAAPRFEGVTLDLVVDYLTYVFVPAYALLRAGLLGPGWDYAAVAVILLTSVLYFSDTLMKTEDYWFRGFPSLWNIVVFYLLLLHPAPAAIFVLVLALGALTFAPIVFVHPLRVVALRPLTLTLLVVWSLLACTAIWNDMAPAKPVVWGLCAVGAYFLILGAFRATPAR